MTPEDPIKYPSPDKAFDELHVLATIGVVATWLGLIICCVVFIIGIVSIYGWVTESEWLT